MPIEDPVREVAVDVGEHLGHEVLADLTRVVAQAVRVPGISGEQQQAHVLERVAAQHHRRGFLHVRRAVGVHVLNPPGLPVAVGENLDDPAVGLEVQDAGRQRFGD